MHALCERDWLLITALTHSDALHHGLGVEQNSRRLSMVAVLLHDTGQDQICLDFHLRLHRFGTPKVSNQDSQPHLTDEESGSDRSAFLGSCQKTQAVGLHQRIQMISEHCESQFMETVCGFIYVVHHPIHPQLAKSAPKGEMRNFWTSNAKTPRAV